MTKVKPKVFITMPCYGDMKVETCVSILNTYSALAKAGVECKFKSVRSSLVTHARNLATCAFLHSGYDYMLFVDADVEFPAEAVLRMLVPQKDVVCTPYRVKTNVGKMDYAVKFKDPDFIKILPWDLVEITEGPAGLMLISRKVFDKLMVDYPKLQSKFDDEDRAKMNSEVGTETDVAAKYMWNFWDTSFEDGRWKGEDLSFCNLVTKSGFKIYANLDSWTTHHGSYGWRGKFGDSLIKKPIH